MPPPPPVSPPLVLVLLLAVFLMTFICATCRICVRAFMCIYLRFLTPSTGLQTATTPTPVQQRSAWKCDSYCYSSQGPHQLAVPCCLRNPTQPYMLPTAPYRHPWYTRNPRAAAPSAPSTTLSTGYPTPAPTPTPASATATTATTYTTYAICNQSGIQRG